MSGPGHPSARLLGGYADGEIAPGPALVVGAHLRGCATCRYSAAAREEAQGRQLMELPDAPLPPGALARTLRAVRTGSSEASDEPPPLFEGVRIPAAVARIGLTAPRRLDARTWVAHLDAPRTDGWRTYLFQAPPASYFPEHGHPGDELVCVLYGAYLDGRVYAVGDFSENRAGSEHDMRVVSDDPCICLVSTFGPVAWRPQDQYLGEALDI